MSNKMRWRYGDTNPVIGIPTFDSHIEIGDLVWLNRDGDVQSAKEFPFTHDNISFKHCFLGISMQESRSGDSAPIRISTSGVFEFDCNPDTFMLGNYVCPEINDNNICNQVVVKTINREAAIGRVCRIEKSPSRSVLVDIVSTIMRGGV